MKPVPRPSEIRNLARFSGVVAVVLAIVGVLSDTTSLLANKGFKRLVSRSMPYALLLVCLVLVFLLSRETRRRQTAEVELSRRLELLGSTWKRLVRVLGAGSSLTAVASVQPERIQPLFDELAAYLSETLGSHQKYSVALPNLDGTFSLLATRGMDPASVSAIERDASWVTGRSFYASLLNDPQNSECKLFVISDTSYVDTRSAQNAATRQTSSGSHFLIALRDPDIYKGLPKNTIGIVSIGIPKGVDVSSSIDSLFRRVEPVARAIESLLLAFSLSHTTNPAGVSLKPVHKPQAST